MATVTAASTAGSSTSRRRPDRGRRREVVAGYLFSLPFLVLFLVFTVGPVIASFLMSFTDLRSADIRNPLAVGSGRPRELLEAVQRRDVPQGRLQHGVLRGRSACRSRWGSRSPSRSLLDTGITRLRTFFRVGYYLPVVTSIVAVAVVWRFLLQPDSGIVNTLLGYVGIDGPVLAAAARPGRCPR